LWKTASPAGRRSLKRWEGKGVRRKEGRNE
jgi:hypothetical protein